MVIKITGSEKGQTLIEFAIIIFSLMLLVLGSMQLCFLYAVKHIVQYAAYTACRVGIVNYDEDGRFDMEKIRLAAAMALSPVSKSEKMGGGQDILPGFMIELLTDRGRIAGAMSMTEIEFPHEEYAISLHRIRQSENPPELTVRIKYKYRPIFPRFFEEEKDKGYVLPISAEATMPVEIGPPFTP